MGKRDDIPPVLPTFRLMRSTEEFDVGEDEPPVLPEDRFRPGLEPPIRPDFLQRVMELEAPAADISLVAEVDTLQAGLGKRSREEAPPQLQPIQDGRYLAKEMLGGGGQGFVRGVYDRYLHRDVALKTLHEHQLPNPDAVRDFLREAILTAQLSHPGIVPIHDVATMDNGAPCYTMKQVRGRSLRQILKVLRTGDPTAARTWSRRRLIEVLVQVAQAVGYAHARGVLHRDLKPPNVMVGDFGEVLVLDWGVARVIGETTTDTNAPVTLPSDVERETIPGTIKGTLVYMAPEQATGDTEGLTARTDVFAIGLMLYELLTWCPARPALPLDQMLPLIREGEVGSAEQRRRQEGLDLTPIPEELDAIIAGCCALDPADRYPDGQAVARALQAFLDGEARRARAEARAVRAEQRAREARQLEEEAQRLAAEVRRVDNWVPPWAPIDQRRRVWALEDEVRAARSRQDAAYADAVALFTQALGDDPENLRARRGLARMYLDRLREAELFGRVRDTLQLELQIRQLDDGTLADALRGEGSLELHSDPPGLDVWLYKLVQEDRTLRPKEPRALGRTPLRVDRLAMGRYLAVVRPGGGRELRYPIWIRRQSHWSGKIKVFRNLPANFILVPGGVFTFGGDRAATGSGSREEILLGDFAIARLPVTCDDYLAFLTDISEQHGHRAAERMAPRPSGDGDGVGKTWWHIKKGGGFRIPAEDRAGGIWGPTLPVRAISREDAEAYCAWLSDKERRRYRLPTEHEWEKAARGVDGRWYPWGDLFDPTFCKMRDTRPGAPEPEPVGSVPLDESPYGVRDMAGNIMEWCSTSFDRHGLMGVVKGGFWLSSAESCRSARRFGFKPSEPGPFAGFRLVLDLDEGAE